MSLALNYWMGGAHHCSGPPVSEMTYTVSSGTLNPSIPYNTREQLWITYYKYGVKSSRSQWRHSLNSGLHLNMVSWPGFKSYKKLSHHWQTARRLCAKCNGVAKPLITRPSSYVLTRRIWSFYIKGCWHKYRRTPKIGELGTLLSWDGRRGRPKDSVPPHMCWLIDLTWLIAVAMSRRHASAAHSRTPSIVFGHAPCE